MLLSLVVFVPLVTALVMLFVRKEQEKLLWGMGLIGTAIPLLISLYMITLWGTAPEGTGAHIAGMKFTEHFSWIPSVGVNYTMGVDGFAFSMIVLSALLFFLAVYASYGYITERVKDYLILVLILATGTAGVFASLDFILFYVFWEIVLLPMYFLIGIWGGERREYAAIKFFLYTLIGSVIMLVGAIYLYLQVSAQLGYTTFNILEMAVVTKGLPVTALTTFAFLALVVGFAVKVPMWPFHTWLPDAHVEAPTPISMLLAGILLKLGSYAMVRISHPMLPQVAYQWAWVLAGLGIVSIVYAAFAAMAQKDFKRQVALSSVNHMGFFTLALAAASLAPTAEKASVALAGGYYVTIAHGLISPLFFFVVGMFYVRTHTRQIPAMSGMFLTVPAVAFVTAFTAFANLGLPGLAGFIGEFIALTGSYAGVGLWVLLAGAGLVITAAWHLMTMRQVLFGKAKEEYLHGDHALSDISGQEMAISASLGVLILLFGVWPAPILDLLNKSVTTLAALLVR
jgi:NADH-quinone oxidoreductase subunit M